MAWEAEEQLGPPSCSVQGPRGKKTRHAGKTYRIPHADAEPRPMGRAAWFRYRGADWGLSSSLYWASLCSMDDRCLHSADSPLAPRVYVVRAGGRPHWPPHRPEDKGKHGHLSPGSSRFMHAAENCGQPPRGVGWPQRVYPLLHGRVSELKSALLRGHDDSV
jgi:hypothetical protein